MRSSAEAFIEALRWNLRLSVGYGVLPLVLLLALATAAASEAPGRAVAASYLVESFGFAAYSIYLAASLAAGGRGVQFELNLFSSYEVVYLAKVVAFAISLSPAALTAGSLGWYLGVLDPAAVLTRWATATAVFSASLLLTDQRSSILFLVILLALTPPASLTVVNSMVVHGAVGGPNGAVMAFAAFVAPISMYAFKQYVDIYLYYSSAIAVSAVLIAAGLAAFRRIEVNPAD
ncbi:MAG: hypothetical protein ACP5I3_11605 [Thermoproteus sp.]